MPRKITFLTIFCVFSFGFAHSQLLKFDFNSNPYLQVSDYHEKLIISELSVSSRTISTNVVTGDYFTDEPYIESSGDWHESNLDDAKYLYFGIEAFSEYQFNIQSISFDAYATNSGPTAIAVMIDDVVVYSQSIAAASLENIVIPISSFDEQIQNRVKIIGWDDASRESSGGGALRIDNLVVEGAVELAPIYDSNSTINIGSYAVPHEISSLHSPSDSIKALDFYVVDSALTDHVPTIIDSLFFYQPKSATYYPLTQIIAKARLYNSIDSSYADAEISDSTLFFQKANAFTIPQGVDKTQSFELFIWLRDTAYMDEKNMQFILDYSNIYCNRKGSNVGFGSVQSGNDNLVMQVDATEINGFVEDTLLHKDASFYIYLAACDDKGNVDKSVNQEFILSTNLEYGTLNMPDDFLGLFHAGEFLQDGFSLSASDTLTILTESNGLVAFSQNLQSIENVDLPKYPFSEDLAWENHQDWRFELIDTITDAYRMVHNLDNISSTSYIAAPYAEDRLLEGKMVWRFVLENGNFDPTSSNRFWYYIMASDANLLSDSIKGYAVGVNFSGSNDTLSLYRIDENAEKVLILQSTLNWDENMRVAVEVCRDHEGNWQLNYADNDGFENKTSSAIAHDNRFSTLNYHGLVFQYSSTRAGELAFEPLAFHRYNQPPFLKAIIAENAEHIILNFSEAIDSVSAKDKSSYSLHHENGEILAVNAVQFDAFYANTISLQVEEMHTANYTIQVHVIKDVDGFAMQTQTQSFEYAVPVANGDVVINEIMFDCSPVVGLPEYDYVELFNRSNEPFQMEGWKLHIGNYTRTLSSLVIEPKEHIILTSSSGLEALSSYGKTIVGMGSTYLTNAGKSIALTTNSGLLIDSVNYNPEWILDPEKEDGGWSIERIDYNNLCGTQSNWEVSVAASGGTPGEENSIYRTNIDIISPKLIQCKFASDTTLNIAFSESMQHQTNVSLINISGAVGTPDSLVWNTGSSQHLEVYFASPFESGKQYQISLQGFLDECNNQMEDTIIAMVFYKPKLHDVVFTELMYDATPSNGLPAKEYLELYNRSVYTIDLSGWQLVYDTYQKEFPAMELLANEYLIVCAQADTNVFSAYGKTLGLISSTTLSGTGKELRLLDSKDQLIDFINYSPVWHSDAEKLDGGWSLEKIDPNNTCSGALNWKTSDGELGGTPGNQNSVFASFVDDVVPEVIYFKSINPSTFIIEFSEAMETQRLVNLENYHFAQQNIVMDSLSNFGWPSNTVALHIRNIMMPNWEYQIEIKGLQDYCGNVLHDTILSYQYVESVENDIVITEILSDPFPAMALPEYEFIELFNRSDKAIPLEHWEIGVNDNFKPLPRFLFEPKTYLILCEPEAYDAFSVFGKTLAVEGFSSLPNENAKVQLLDTASNSICEVSYQKQWHSSTEKGNGGWTLEKRDPDNVCSQAENWSSSKSIDGGTPGKQNDMFGSFIDDEAPFVTAINPINERQLALIFSESVPLDQNNSLQNFRFVDQSVIIDSANHMLGNDQVIYIHLAAPMNFDEYYQLQISNLSDVCENVLTDTTLSFRYIKVEANDVVINEIYADPSPSNGLPEFEYVELYNRSDKAINLEGFSLQVNDNVKTLASFILKPEHYVIICDDGAEVEFKDFGEVSALATFPSIPNDSARVQLNDTAMQPISQIIFESVWYADNEKSKGGWSLERIDPDNLCSTLENWKASSHTIGGTPGQRNAVDSTNIDQTGIIVNSIYALDAFTLELVLSEEAQKQDYLIRENFSLESIGSPERVTTKVGNNTHLILSFPAAMQQESNQALDVKNLHDFCANVMHDTVVHFSYYDIQFADIVISEIMANPKPWYGLPDAEYIELYNNAGFDLNLSEWALKSGASFYDIESTSFPKNTYAILCEVEFADEFRTFGKVISLEKMPSIANSGSLSLVNASQQALSYIEYSDAWFENDIKADGAYSLERIDVNNPNNDANNWVGSEHEQGGTPGMENSVKADNPDLQAPNLLMAIPTDSLSLLIVYSESMQHQGIEAVDFVVSEELLPYTLYWVGEGYKRVLLTFNTPFKHDVDYDIVLNETLSDLSGNSLSNNSCHFMLAEPFYVNDVIINEVLFNPSEGGADFIELYNNSESAINLSDMRISTREADGSLKSATQIADVGYILLPSEHVVITENPDKVKQEYFAENEFAFVQADKMISMSNDAGTIVLLDTMNVIIDEFSYASGMHFALIDNVEGISLERINYNRASSDNSNWHSAAQQVGGATPTYQNSVFNEAFNNQSEISIDPEAFSPDNDGYKDVLNIHYAFAEAGFVASAIILNMEGFKVKTLANNEYLSTEGQWTWDGISDKGQKAPVGIYIIFIEAFDLNGNIKKFKKVCVVSARFD